MAKSLLMRPSWVALKLCDGNTISATLLAEILFRANVTKYSKNGNPVIVFSFEEWSDNTGLSIGQVRKALKTLAELGLVRSYTKHHPHKGAVLRALHVEIPALVVELNFYLTSGGYKFEKDVLCLSTDGLSDIKLVPSEFPCSVKKLKNTGHGAITMPNAGTPLCAQGTNLPYIYNKDSKKKHVAAKTAATFVSEEGKKESKTEDKNEEGYQGELDAFYPLKKISTMYRLLLDLHEQYLKYHAEKFEKAKAGAFSASDAGKFWLKCQSEYSPWHQKPLAPKDYALLKMMIAEFTEDELKTIISRLFSDWPKFVQCVFDCAQVYQVPNNPDVGFIFYFRKFAAYIYINKLAEYQEYAST